MISSSGLLRRLEKLENKTAFLLNERDVDALRKRNQRQESARIFIPECVNPQRRERALEDPERFLKTYFADRYNRPFGKLHNALIGTIYEIAKHGGTQAIAAPRGRGKSELTKGMIVYCILAGLIRFPVIVAQTTSPHAVDIYKDFRKKVQVVDLLYEDFPEVCEPVRALEGAPQRASRQHVDGELTNIVWTADELRLGNIPEKHRHGIDYGGCRLVYRGLDSAIRGINKDGDRPDFVVIDDPETKESAKSAAQIIDRRQAIEQDIAGLAGEDHELSMVMLTTIQNRTCLSFEYTDPEQKASWMGQRFGWIEKWPDHEDLWEQYMELRKEDQRGGDRYGRNATQFYLDNRERMDAGVELLSDNYKSQTLKDGWVTVHSGIQEAYNFICDKNRDAFFTEFQNDPPEKQGPQGSGLDADLVGSRISGLDRFQLPANTVTLTAGIDLGKYRCHWVVCAWWKGAGGCVVDYGVAEVTGTDTTQDNEASEPHIYRALLAWRDELMQKNYVDAAGQERKVDAVFVDSGTFTNAAYEFQRQVQGPFRVCKGLGKYRARTKSTDTIKAGDNMHASWLSEDKVWLFDLSTDYWKNWVHERFLTPTFDDSNFLRQGSLSLYLPQGSKKHTSYAQHIVAEEWVSEFVEGKGSKNYWLVKNDNNHWLDATYYAACAGRFQGVHLLSGPEVENAPRAITPEEAKKPKRKRTQHGSNPNKNRFRRRKGGWVKGARG